MSAAPAESKSRGCLTAHFNTKIDLDYPCTLATTSSAEAAREKRDREARLAAEQNSGFTAPAPTNNPMAADIPYVTNVTQATLEIRKSQLFIEKHAVFKREQEMNAAMAVGGVLKPKKKKYATKEEEAEAIRVEGILADPIKVIENRHFVLNALPEIGNTGRPLALCHFYVDNSTVVTSSTAASSDDVLAVVRVPLHLCTSVGRQGREDTDEEKRLRRKNKGRLPIPDLAEGGSTGLAGFELIYAPRRDPTLPPRKPAGAADDETAENPELTRKFGEKRSHSNANNNKSKKGGKAGKHDANAKKRFVDVFPVAFFDVSVNISGVQYTYLLHSQFDVLAGKSNFGPAAPSAAAPAKRK